MSGGSHSPNLGLLNQEAFIQNIDRLVEALEMEAMQSKMSKGRKLFSDQPSNSALQVYQPLDLEKLSSSALQVYQPLECLIVPSFPKFEIALKELSMLSGTRFFPYVNTQRFKIDGIVKISSGIFQSIGECRSIVPPFEVKAEFLKRTGRKYKKDAWQDITPWFGLSLTHSEPCSEGWLVDDFKKFSLEGYPDGYAFDK
ncbi:hypothetical protein R1flu_020184 [Riccia fluitans]|uniref:Uncharacterized protein n=1 Tax=Riccia fluitans TaxID=41844 RepID=A0ABD1ZMZ2_9MARC